jgi:hypothetical protein
MQVYYRLHQRFGKDAEPLTAVTSVVGNTLTMIAVPATAGGCVQQGEKK